MQEILTQKSRDVKGSPRSQRKKMFQPSPSSRGSKIRKSSPSGNIRLKVVYGRRTKQKTSQISSSSVQLVDCSSDSNKLISGDNIPDSALAQKVENSMDKLSQVSPFCLQSYGSEISAAFLNRVQNYCILGKDADFSIISKKAVQKLCISSPEMEVRKSTKTGTIVVNDEAISNTDSGVAFGNVSSEAIVSSENTRRLQRLAPTNTWVCSENDDKCKPAADVVLKTYCRRSFKDNHDKALADCPIRQEKSNAEINAVSSSLEVEKMEPVTGLFDDFLSSPLNVDNLAGISEALQANGGLGKPASYHQQEMPTETKTMEISSPSSQRLQTVRICSFEFAEDAMVGKKLADAKSCPSMKSPCPSKVPANHSASSIVVDGDDASVPANEHHMLHDDPKDLLEASTDGHLQTVEDKLNDVLDVNGGICKRKDASRGYRKLLRLTVASGDNGNVSTIQSNRDLSIILDALLKTKSRGVLVDIINKKGLQMLQKMMKRYARDFNKIPILRKLLKVLEFLAERDILTRGRIIADPHRPGVKSLRELVLSLTEHEDRKVRQMARSFRDKWIPRIRKFSCDDSGDRGFEMDRFMGSQAIDGMKPAAKMSDSFDIDGSSSQVNSCVTADVCARKRKSRWDQPADPFHLHGQNENKLEGRSPTNASTGKPRKRFVSLLPVAYGIPFSVILGFGTLQGKLLDCWVVAPGIPFCPFPPLPVYFRGSGSGESRHSCRVTIGRHNRSDSRVPNDCRRPASCHVDQGVLVAGSATDRLPCGLGTRYSGQ
ncbi:hypothetical protein Drorol1_Dr00020575 [Drosera rotundifolia]